MSEFNAGTIRSIADVDIRPFDRGMASIEKRGKDFARARYKATAEVDDDPANKTLDRLEERMAKLGTAKGRINLSGYTAAERQLDAIAERTTRLDGSTVALSAKLTGTAAGELEYLEELSNRLDGRVIAMRVGLIGNDQARDAMAGLELQAGQLGGSSPTITPRVADAASKAQLGALAALADGLGTHDPTITPHVSDGAANAQLAALAALADGLGTHDPTITARGDTAAAEAALAAVLAQAAQVGGADPTVHVDAEVAAAMAQIAALQARLDALEAKRTNANVGVSGGGQAQLMLAAIVALLGAIGYAAPAAAAALAMIPGALAGAGQLVGGLTAGLSGISDAYTAMGAADEAGASKSAGAGKQRQAAADQVAGAVRSLAQAQDQADRNAIQSGWQVADAARAVADARAQADQRVAEAGAALATARAAASERIADADRTAERAAASLRLAQDALTASWAKGRQELADLQLQIRGVGLSQERAALQARKAHAALDQGIANGVGGDALEELQLAAKEADLQIDEAANSMGKLRVEQSAFDKDGVAGSNAVRSARSQLAAQEQAYGDALRTRQRAQVEGDHQVATAEAALHAAEVQGRKAVDDAERQLERTAIQAGWSRSDAAAAVTAAQDQLARAIRDQAAGAGGGAAANDKLAAAMAKLTPEGREFVRFLHDEWTPSWRTAFAPVQSTLLPGVENGMRRLMGLQPTLSAGLQGTADVVGRLAIEGGKLTEEPAFRRDLATIMDGNNRALWNFGQAGLTGVSMATDLGAATTPLLERLSRLADNSMQAAESWLLGKIYGDNLTGTLQVLADRFGQVWDWLVQTAGGAWNLISSLAPLGGVLLAMVANTAQFIGWLAQLSPTMTSIVGGAAIAAIALWKLGGALTALRASTAIGGITSIAGALRTGLNPAALYATPLLARLTSAGASVGGALGAATGKVTGSATAMQSGAAAGTKFGNAVRGASASLPLLGAVVVGLGAGVDALTVSVSEAEEGLLRGGAAARKSREDIAYNDDTIRETADTYGVAVAAVQRWVNENIFGLATSQSVREEDEKRRAGMTNLQRAQEDATISQGNYEDAVRTFGASSQEAQGALAAMSARSRDVEIAQTAVREKTDLATAAVIYQRDTILGTLNADLRKRQAVDQLAQSQQAYSDAVRAHGPASAEAERAGLQLEQNQLQVADAAKAGRDGMLGYARSIGDMVASTRGQLTPTLSGLVQSLDWAGLSAAGAQVKIDGAGRAVATFPDGKTVVLDANTSAAVAQVNFVKFLVDGTRGTIGVDADTGPGVATVGGFKLMTDRTTGVVTINGNISPADQQRLGIQAKTDGTTGTMWIDGNPVPADGRLNGMRVTVDRTTGVMTVDANTRPADDASRAAHDTASRPATIPVNADTRPAESSWSRFWRQITSWRWWVGMEPGQAFGNAQGSVLYPAAHGALLAADHQRVAAMAGGGGLSPMSGSTATVVQPNTWRVIGDNMTVPESFIPHDDSARSQDILAQTARQMGYALVPRNAIAMAAGGMLGATAAPTGPVGAGAATGPGAGDGAAAATTGPTAAPVGVDAGEQAAAAACMSMVTDAALEQAATLTGVLVPALEAQQAATLATELGQQSLVAAGLTPLVTAVDTLLAPALGLTAPAAHLALQGAQTATQLSSTTTAANTAANTTWMTGATTAMSLASQAQHAGLRYGHALTQQSQNVTAAVTAARNGDMMASTGQMSAVNQGHLAGLRGAQGVTTGSTVAFADAWRAQLGRTMPDSANPIRWVINTPIRGITDAWNNLDGQFALGKHVNPYIPGFAGGGRVGAPIFAGSGQVFGPGTGTSDDVNARLSDGEFVVRESIASRHLPFLRALNAGQAEARGAAGGTGARMPGYAAGGPVAAAQQFARAQAGKPYVWGGVGPGGYDCSGLWSAITNVARGLPPYRRIGTAASNPWPGFVPGLSSALAIGANSHHMAGTIGGMNAEARTTGQPVYAGGPAVGADNGQFRVHASLPMVGGQFVSGGAGGGGGFDPTPIVDAAFAKVYQQIGDVPRLFGPSDQVARDQGVAKFSADKVRALALDKITAAMGTMDVSGISGPVVDQVRQVAARYGWSQGPPWDNGIFPLVAKESSWNPGAASPRSSARGLFQKMTSIHGPVEPTPAGQAAWGLNYIKSRYGDPVRAWAFHRAHGYYDDGGVASGTGLLPKATPDPERVLSPRQTVAWERLVDGALDSVDATGSVSMLGGDALERIETALAGAGTGGDGVADAVVELRALRTELRELVTEIAATRGGDVHVHPSADHSEERIGRAVRSELDWQGRL